MRFLVTLLISLIAAVALGLVLVREPGYVLIGYGEWTLETRRHCCCSRCF